MRGRIGTRELELRHALRVDLEERLATHDDVSDGPQEQHTGRHVCGRPGALRDSSDLPATPRRRAPSPSGRRGCRSARASRRRSSSWRGWTRPSAALCRSPSFVPWRARRAAASGVVRPWSCERPAIRASGKMRADMAAKRAGRPVYPACWRNVMTARASASVRVLRKCGIAGRLVSSMCQTALRTCSGSRRLK